MVVGGGKYSIYLVCHLDQKASVMAYNLFNRLLDLVVYYFVEDFYSSIHKGIWSVVFFFIVSLFGF